MNAGRNGQRRPTRRAITYTFLGLGLEPVIGGNGNAPARQLRGGFLIVTLLTCLVSAASAAGRPVRWRSPDVAVRASMTSVEAAQALEDITRPGKVRHVVVQFSEPVGPALRAQLGNVGVELLGALGDNAFFAAIDRKTFRPEQAGQIGSLEQAYAIGRNAKLHPMLLRGETPAWTVVRRTAGGPVPDDDPVVVVYVLFHRDVPQEDAVRLSRLHGAEVRARLRSVNGLVIELAVSRIAALADEDAVQWVEPALPALSETNNNNREAVGADVVQAPPYDLDGSGVVVMVFDTGRANSLHPDFNGRLTNRDDDSLSDHASHVAGTIGGDGTASGGLYRGMAPGVLMESYGFEYGPDGIWLYTNLGDLEADYGDAINNQGAVLANNSLSTNVEFIGWPCEIQGDYGLGSSVIDAIVRGSLGSPIGVFWANGNERGGSRCDVEGFGDYYSMPPPACAKNHITVGATNSDDNSITYFTSWGPCDDGRLKPDLTAPGCQSGTGGVISCSLGSGYSIFCGTSMACPTVTGVAALLLEDYRNQFPNRPDFLPSTLKALLVHNALDLANTGPDYQTGYGLVRARETIDFMRTGNFLEADVDQGQIYSLSVVVEPGTPQLTVTLAWDDAPGTPNVEAALVNDLDLLVTGPAGTFHPWTLDPLDPAAPAVRTGPDHLNNIEQVVVDDPTPGTWFVQVHGFSVPQGPQTFSIAGAVCTGGPLPGDLNCDGVVGIADFLAVLAAWGSCESCPADLDGDGIIGVDDLLIIIENWG